MALLEFWLAEPMYEKLKEKSVFITGGAGFIGSHLAERLLNEGSRVIVLDNLSSGRMKHIEHLIDQNNFTFIQGDVNRFDDIAGVFSDYRINYVFHYAALVGVKHVIERPLDVFKDIDGVKFLLALSNVHHVEKVVFASSSEAYGEPVELPEREDGRLNVNVNDPYGLTKLVGENMMRNYWRRYGLAGTSLRFFNVYGPRQNASAYGFVVGIFIKNILNGEKPEIYGDGTQTRDFVYIDDNIEAAIRALLTDKTNGQILNIGSGRQTTILELAERVGRLADRGVTPEFAPAREVEVRYRCPDITKMKMLLDFTPKIGLDEGLQRTLEWFSEEEAARNQSD